LPGDIFQHIDMHSDGVAGFINKMVRGLMFVEANTQVGSNSVGGVGAEERKQKDQQKNQMLFSHDDLLRTDYSDRV